MRRIPDQADAFTIETVRGQLDRHRADELLTFWLERRALTSLEARRRLPEVVCAMRLEGALVGSSSVYATNVALIGGRRFWVYRSVLDQVVAEHAPAMIRATFNALAAEFDGADGSPVGLCVLARPALRRQRPEAEWSDPRMLYAGYLPEGLQLRIAYFDGAVIA
ncbi:MAG TPA: hypothetical protein VMD09_02655 [Solirubrobacteraceae bacterium]|nr:hypothetical protein [Solirubrobacteraceae bacterium]